MEQYLAPELDTPVPREPSLPLACESMQERQMPADPARVLTTALEAAANAIVIADREGRITWANRAFTELTGYTLREVAGQNPRVLKSDVHDPVFYRKLWETVLAGEVWSGEVINRRKDGSLYEEEMTITPVCGLDGAISHFIAIKQDISARKRAERALSRSALRYRSLADSLPEIVIETDLAGAITFANANALRILGYDPDDLRAGLTVLDITAEHDRDRASQYLLRDLNGQNSSTHEYEARRKDGTTFPVLVSTSIILEDHKPLGVRAIAIDITERKRREEALRLTQFSVDHAAHAVFRVEPDGRVAYANEAACRTLGYSADEICAMRVQDFDPEQTAAVWRESWDAIRKAGTIKFEGRHRRKDGVIFPVAITATYSKVGDQEYAFSYVQDITSRKQAEAELAQQQHLFDILMENVPDYIYFKDRQGRFIRISNAQARLFGLNDPAAAIGKTDFDFFSEAHARQSYAEEQQILRTGQPILGRAEKETWPDGRQIWVAKAKMPLSDSEGQVIGTFGISRNITRSKLAEEALRTSEEFNKRILESSSDGVCVLDLKGSVLYVSAGGRKLLELDDSESIPHLDWLGFWEGVDRQKSQSALLDAVSGGVGAYQASLKTRKGTSKLWDIVISPITGSSGTVERVVCVFRDITERRLLESQLAQAQKLESIGQLAAGIAHEINTPIQYIGDNGKFLEEAFQDLLKMIRPSPPADGEVEPEPDVDLEYLQTEIPKAAGQLLEGVQHVARIVRAMKEFSHPGPLEKTQVDINAAIQSTILVSRSEWKYIADLTTDLDPALPKVSCLGGEFNQVMLNLIVNAAHAIADVVDGSGQKGCIQISTRRNGDWAEIRVRDSGPGIPEAIQSKVFDPFFTTKAVGKGTGQGLAIAHAVIVRKHQGRISFESTAGTGTTFLIQLPL